MGYVQILMLVLGSSACVAQASGDLKAPPIDSRNAAIAGFDPGRDAASDIRDGLSEARRTHKRVLLYVGGDWCPYCAELHQLFENNASLKKLRDDNFVVVGVDYSPGSQNRKVLSQYPKPAGIPHYFVLGSDGTLLHSEHLIELRSSGAYDPGKMHDFLISWSLHASQP